MGWFADGMVCGWDSLRWRDDSDGTGFGHEVFIIFLLVTV